MKLKAKQVVCNRKLEFKNRLLDVVANCFGHFLHFLQSVDCTRKQCNYEDRRATKESCQKCKDLEKCYKTTVRMSYKLARVVSLPGLQYIDSFRPI